MNRANRATLAAILAYAAAAGLAHPAWAQERGTAGAVLLRYNFSPRYEGMAGASAAMADDTYAVYANPAGLALLGGDAWSTAYARGLVDDYFGQLGGAFVLDPNWAVGIGLVTYNGGGFHDVDEQGNVKFMNAQSDYLLALSGALRLSPSLRLGLTLEGLHSTLLDHYSGKTAAVIFGIGYEPVFVPRLRAGLVFKHLGFPLGYGSGESDPLPASIQAGAAYGLLESASHDVTLALDAEQGLDTPCYINAGAEYWAQKTYALRAGYRFNRDLEWITLGAGARLPMLSRFPLQVDYSLTLSRAFNSVHKVSLSLLLPSAAGQEAVQQPTIQTTSGEPASVQPVAEKVKIEPVPTAVAQTPQPTPSPEAVLTQAPTPEPTPKNTPVLTPAFEFKEEKIPETSGNENSKLNAITTNPLGLLSFGSNYLMVAKLEYERLLVKHVTLGLQGLYTLQTFNNFFEADGSFIRYGAGLAGRYYFSGDKLTPQGYWVGAMGNYQIAHVVVTKNPVGKWTGSKDLYQVYQVGLISGYRWVVGNWFVISPFAIIFYENNDFAGTAITQQVMSYGLDIGICF